MSVDPSVRTVGIVGLGVVGGSLAHDLASIGVSVLAHDSDAATLAAALSSGVVAQPLGADLERCDTVDVLVIATPVHAAAGLLEILARRGTDAVVTDVCSTKRTIEAAAVRVGLGDRFVGAHPLAGSHRSGWNAARARLFRDARVFICPAPSARDEAIDIVEQLWRRIGARPERMDADTHDRVLAHTSHLPQVVASALVASLRAAGMAADQLGPGGRDATRLAASSPDVWTPIALDNADHLSTALAAFGDTLAALRVSLERGDADAVHDFLAAARDWSGPGL